MCQSPPCLACPLPRHLELANLDHILGVHTIDHHSHQTHRSSLCTITYILLMYLNMPNALMLPRTAAILIMEDRDRQTVAPDLE